MNLIKRTCQKCKKKVIVIQPNLEILLGIKAPKKVICEDCK